MQAIVIAEDFDDDNKGKHKTPEKILAEKEFRKNLLDRGLHDIANIDIFATWQAFGGMQRGISPEEATRWDARQRDDFRLILSELGHARSERERRKTKAPTGAPPPRPKRSIARK